MRWALVAFKVDEVEEVLVEMGVNVVAMVVQIVGGMAGATATEVSRDVSVDNANHCN
jgi:hypothetical protein